MARESKAQRPVQGAGYLAGLSDTEKRKKKGFEFLGFEIRRAKDEEQEPQLVSFVPPAEENESSYITSAGGFYGQTLDVRGDTFNNERDLIIKYRNAAQQPEVDRALEDIVNEAIVSVDHQLPVSVNLDYVTLENGVAEKICKEFETVLQALDFRKYGGDIFKRWYIDGRLSYHVVLDNKDPKAGIKELRPINPIKIKKIKELQEIIDPRTGATVIGDTEEYFVYSEDGFASMAPTGAASQSAQRGLKLPTDSVLYVTSGIMDATRRVSLSYLHKALRNVNQLRMMEEALLIYRFSRAPERLVFSIDIGDMPRDRAAKYMEQLASKYQNKIAYDSSTGEIKDSQRHMSMLENYWLPKTTAGKGTEVSNLPGGQNLGQIEDIEYFQKKLYQALNVPISRLDPDQPFNMGRSQEITRDEVKFQKFIDKLRMRFSDLFKQALRVHLVLKGIVTEDEWERNIKEYIIFDYQKDSFFTEFKESELLRDRIETVTQAQELEGKYFSAEYIRRHILHQDDETIKEIKKQIRAEALSKDGLPEMEGEGGEGGPGGGMGGGAAGGMGDMPTGGPEPDADEEFGSPEGEVEGGDGAPVGDPEGAATELGPEGDDTVPEEESLTDDEDLNPVDSPRRT